MAFFSTSTMYTSQLLKLLRNYLTDLDGLMEGVLSSNFIFIRQCGI